MPGSNTNRSSSTYSFWKTMEHGLVSQLPNIWKKIYGNFGREATEFCSFITKTTLSFCYISSERKHKRHPDGKPGRQQPNEMTGLSERGEKNGHLDRLQKPCQG
jgi:hypothetical protein